MVVSKEYIESKAVKVIPYLICLMEDNNIVSILCDDIFSELLIFLELSSKL